MRINEALLSLPRWLPLDNYRVSCPGNFEHCGKIPRVQVTTQYTKDLAIKT